MLDKQTNRDWRPLLRTGRVGKNKQMSDNKFQTRDAADGNISMFPWSIFVAGHLLTNMVKKVTMLGAGAYRGMSGTGEDDCWIGSTSILEIFKLSHGKPLPQNSHTTSRVQSAENREYLRTQQLLIAANI